MVVVEVVAGNKPATRIRSQARRLTIGRSLDNDIVVDDPYVDGKHIVLRELDRLGNWELEDLGSTNGTIVAGHPVSGTSIEVALSTEIHIGKTRLRLLDIHHSVPPAKSLRDLEHWLLGLGTLRWISGLGIAVVVAHLLPSYLSTWQELKLSSLFNSFAILLVALLFNTAVWSLLSRVLRGEARFAALLAITCIEMLILAGAGFFGDVAEYNLAGSSSSGTARFVGEVGLGCVFLYATLRVATTLGLVARSTLSVLAFVAILSMYFVNLSADDGEFDPNPAYDGRLMPPPLLLRDGDSAAQFTSALPEMFERARTMADGDDAPATDPED